ncbi:hypothetical protein GCM10023320_19310 [Pseudonocardia adelaidensis]|uniref:Uncharacterized protein n=1 Tax=Pseudonocardia adelaidensis TaxID=648754 RepID=A0ABP9NGU9_9PSEU
MPVHEAGHQVARTGDRRGGEHPGLEQHAVPQDRVERAPGRDLHEPGGHPVPGLAAHAPLPGRGDERDVAQPGDGLLQRPRATRRRVVGGGQAGGVVQQLAHGDLRGPRVGRAELGQVRDDRIVQRHEPGPGQLRQDHRGERLGHPAEPHRRLPGDRLAAGVVAVPADVQDPAVVDHGDRDAREPGGADVALHERGDRRRVRLPGLGGRRRGGELGEDARGRGRGRRCARPHPRKGRSRPLQLSSWRR